MVKKVVEEVQKEQEKVERRRKTQEKEVDKGEQVRVVMKEVEKEEVVGR